MPFKSTLYSGFYLIFSAEVSEGQNFLDSGHGPVEARQAQENCTTQEVINETSFEETRNYIMPDEEKYLVVIRCLSILLDYARGKAL